MRHALVIEDNHDLCDTLRLMMPLLNWSVTTIEDTSNPEAVHVAPPPDIAIVDMMLSGPMAGALDGIEYARLLRARGVTCPLIAFSASTLQLAAAERTGLFAACLAKPFDIFELSALMARLTGTTDDCE